jgi:hypothetical protein
MAITKTMNENSFAKLLKELNALGEQIRAKQEEKQALLDQFEQERKRLKMGRISETTLASSVKKTNIELIKLDKQIRIVMDKGKKMSARIVDVIRSQQPKVFRAQKSGVFLASGKKKSKAKTKTIKKAKKVSKIKKKSRSRPKPKSNASKTHKKKSAKKKRNR